MGIYTQPIKIIEWNIRGWTKDNKHLRERIILGEYAHVIIVETHLNEDKAVDIEGYKCIQHNRRH